MLFLGHPTHPLTLPFRNKKFESLYLTGQISLELVPQGTLVERIRAHASGIPAFYTPTGASTAVERGTIPIRFNPGGMKAGVCVEGKGKEARVFAGRRYVLEESIVGDVAFVRAWKVDEVGNCVFRCELYIIIFLYSLTGYRYTSHNFNSVMAKNAKLTIVEV